MAATLIATTRISSPAVYAAEYTGSCKGKWKGNTKAQSKVAAETMIQNTATLGHLPIQSITWRKRICVLVHHAHRKAVIPHVRRTCLRVSDPHYLIAAHAVASEVLFCNTLDLNVTQIMCSILRLFVARQGRPCSRWLAPRGLTPGLSVVVIRIWCSWLRAH
jgi:hypothetical protein